MDKFNHALAVHVQQVNQPTRLQRILNRVAVGAVVASTGVAANASYDITEVTTNLGLAVSAAATIGVAWLGFTAGIAIWRNLRAAAR